MPTSDEDLQKLQKDVEGLREKVAAEETKRVTAERELANDVTAANLRAEKARLEAQLATAKAANTKTAVKDSAAVLLDAANEDESRARAQLEATTKAAEKADKADDSTDK